MFACLSEEEQKALGDYLDRIIDALEKNFGETGSDAFERLRAARERFGYDMHGRFGGCRHIHGYGFGGSRGPRSEND